MQKNLVYALRLTPLESTALKALADQAGVSSSHLMRGLLKERAVEQGLWDGSPPTPSTTQRLIALQQAIDTLCTAALPKEVRPSLVPPELSPDDLDGLFK